MVADSTNTLDFLSTLTAAATDWQTRSRPAAAIVVPALLQAEKIARQQRQIIPAAALMGPWRLCFVTGTRKRPGGGIQLGKGFYIPAIGSAQLSFCPTTTESAELAIANQVQLGYLRLKLTGPTRYLSQKHLLAFDFTQIQVNLGSWLVYQGNLRGGKAQTESFEQQAIAKLPFFAFFLVTDQFIAARGRGGGLALWVAEKR